MKPSGCGAVRRLSPSAAQVYGTFERVVVQRRKQMNGLLISGGYFLTMSSVIGKP